MISGEDTVFLVHVPVSAAVERFLDGWLTTWPQMRVALDDSADCAFAPWRGRQLKLPQASGQILVARDKAMQTSWDDLGYKLDATGEGPFCIAYEKANWSRLAVSALEDPYARNGFAFQPYEVTLVGADYFLLSTVTPEGENAFSSRLIHQLLDALAAVA